MVKVGVFIISESVIAKERGPSEGDFGLKCLEEILILLCRFVIFIIYICCSSFGVDIEVNENYWIT